MKSFRVTACAICGEEPPNPGSSFLLTENRWEDTLKVLRWSAEVSQHPAVRLACCTAHVRELVLHWMTTGSLNYPFAQFTSAATAPQLAFESQYRSGTGRRTHVLGELSVDRSSIGRIFSENARSVELMLGALEQALNREPVRMRDSGGVGGELNPMLWRQI